MISNLDNYGTPQQYMARFGVKASTFRSRVKRGQVVFNDRGFVDYAKTNANLRQPRASRKHKLKMKLARFWVDFDELQELNQVHNRHKLHREKQ